MQCEEECGVRRCEEECGVTSNEEVCGVRRSVVCGGGGVAV